MSRRTTTALGVAVGLACAVLSSVMLLHDEALAPHLASRTGAVAKAWWRGGFAHVAHTALTRRVVRPRRGALQAARSQRGAGRLSAAGCSAMLTPACCRLALPCSYAGLHDDYFHAAYASPVGARLRGATSQHRA
jgi:hypothetical protein